MTQSQPTLDYRAAIDDRQQTRSPDISHAVLSLVLVFLMIVFLVTAFTGIALGGVALVDQNSTVGLVALGMLCTGGLCFLLMVCCSALMR